MAVDSTTIHLLAGGMGGTAGAVLTCPLEVVKTRLQSSVATFQKPVYVTNVTYVPPQPIASANYVTCCNGSVNTQTVTMAQARSRTTTSLYSCLNMGGTAGAVLTCPLEVVKTRLQSSVATFQKPVYVTNVTYVPPQPIASANYVTCCNGSVNTQTVTMAQARSRTTTSLYSCLNMGGTAGAVLTCPLEVVKTRLQSSVATFQKPVYVTNVTYVPPQPIASANYVTCCNGSVNTQTVTMAQARSRTTTSLYSCLKYIVQNEGAKALFKGLGPNLVGVAPSRAVYFCTYAQTKMFCNSIVAQPETPLVHICSAASAGFTASTLTNPIWFIKTRLQLDQKRHHGLTVGAVVRDVYKRHGLSGFYKGITASYYGIAETVIHFVIYEAIKARLRELKTQYSDVDERSAVDFLEFMAAGAVSKTCATCAAYPHEVARTRLRQEGGKYTGFWQSLRVVFMEEGVRGLYRGMATQLVRQIPNTAIMMSTYEFVVHMCSSPSDEDT